MKKNVKVKVEPGMEESTNGPVGMEKPNILKKKKTVGTNNIIQQQEDKSVEEYFALPIVSREGNLYTCLLCQGDETVAGEAKAITIHMKQGHGARIYICDVCGQDFQNATNFLLI
ncbi:hypothetical protein NQ314_007995 [Rhamnusium bicolor]|uniref:Zinc finger protein n=1 Tax=Rhamnusium bicolor TaxID=1586634 RepID=A0AAV8YG27_9CUCU|nr:hypothetical protein NQ314_007995 [Rhamnusium bicolor]